jgi:CxxC-x17-CxxC domain-containing protein
MTEKPMFEAKCTSCGKIATVPFKPTEGKPVYCRECFSKNRTRPPQTSGEGAISFVGKEGWARRRNIGQTQKDKPANFYQEFTHAP